MKTFIATYLLDKEGELNTVKDKPIVEQIQDKIEYVFDKANDYERIKEKLIGETFEYAPKFSYIINGILMRYENDPELIRFLRDNTALRVSRSTKDLAYQIIKFKDEYLINNGIEATPDIIANNLGIDEYQIGYALDALKDPTSIFEPIYNDGGDTIYLADQIADLKDKNSDKDALISLRKALLKIKKREKDILLARFIIGKTQTEIAEELNISQAQVSRIEKSAIENVRKLIK